MPVDGLIADTDAISLPEAIALPERNLNPEPARIPAPPIAMLGVGFDSLTFDEATDRIETMIASRRPHYVVTANVDFLVQARRDVELRRIFLDAHLVLCDGTPLVWASRLLGNPLPERVAGSDMVPRLIRRAAEKDYRLFFLGATSEANEQAVARVRGQFPNANIAGHYSPAFRPLLEMDHSQIAQRIRATQPDLLFVAFGCPKAEKWIAMHYRSLGVPVSIGIGATIDFLAGRVKRAPGWMQRSGTEWIYRMCQEPRRLFRRYTTDFWHFGRAITAQYWRTRTCRRSSQPTPACSLLCAGDTWRRILLPDRLDADFVRNDGWSSKIAWNCHCLLDVAEVQSIDSTGVGWLLFLRKELQAANRSLILLAPSRAIRQALSRMGVAGFFEKADGVLEARELIREREQEAQAHVVSGLTQRLAWRGEITAANAEEVWRQTRAEISSKSSWNKQWLIDLSQVRFIDSSGLSVMIRARKYAPRRGACVRFSGAPAAVRNVLRLSKLEGSLLQNTP